MNIDQIRKKLQGILGDTVSALPGGQAVKQFHQLANSPQQQQALARNVGTVANVVTQNPLMKMVASRPLINQPGQLPFSGLFTGKGTSYSPSIGDYAQGHIVAPAIHAYQDSLKAFNDKTSLPNRIGAAINAPLQASQLMPTMQTAMVPWHLLEGAKSGIQAQRTGQDANKAIAQGISGQKFTGLGDAVTGNKNIAGVLNASEMIGPLMHGFVRPALANAKGMVMKKTYSDVMPKLEDSIKNVIVRYEKSAGEAYNPAHPVVDLELENDAKQLWKTMFGMNKKAPEKLDHLIGDVFENYHGWREEQRQGLGGIRMGFAETPKINTELRNALAGAQSAQDEAMIIHEFTDLAIKNKTGNSLKATRASLNQELQGLAGKSGNYKQDFATLQTLRKDPNIAAKIDALESNIAKIDDALAGKKPQVSNIDWQEYSPKDQLPIGSEIKMENGKQYYRQTPPGSLPPEGVINPENPFYNVNRMGVDDTVKQQVKDTIQSPEVVAKIDTITGQPLTHAEVQKQAQVSEVLKKTFSRKDAEEVGAQALALRQKVADLAKLGLNDDQYKEALIQDKAFGQYIARLFGQRRIISNPEQKTVFTEMIGKIIKEGFGPDDVAAAAKKVDFTNPQQAATFYRNYIKTKPGEWLDLLRYNSMLSSPNTQLNNAFSNYGNSAIIAPIEKTITGSLDFLGSAVTGKERSAFAGEGAVYAKGYIESVGTAAHKFADVMRGISPETNLDTHNVPLATKGLGKVAYNTLNVPMKLLEGMDQFFGAMVEGGETAALNYRASKGVKVADVVKQAKDNAAYRLFRSDTHTPQQGHLLNAVDEVTSVIQKLRSSKNPIASTVSKFSLPFIKTPMNIFKQSIEYSPAGLMTLPGANNKTEQLSKAILGTAAFAGAATLLASGRTTWAEPTDEKKKAAFRAAGMQPYAVRIGDQWVSYAKLPPALAANLALVSAIHDAQENQTMDQQTADTVLEGIAKWGNFFADQSYVKQIGDLVSMTKGDAESVSKYWSNYPQQLIPYRALMGWVARIADPYQRKVDRDGTILQQQIQQLETQIPGYSQNVPARLDNNGNPIENQNRVLNAFSPVRITSATNPTAEQEYQDLRAKSLDTKNINIMKEKLGRNGEQSMQYGNNLVYSGADGTMHTVDLAKNPQAPQLTGNPELDKKLISTYNSQISQKMGDIAELYSIGKLSAVEAEQQLSALKTQKLGGGSKKGRKVSFKKIKMPRLSIKAPKALKLKAMKLAKATKTKQIKLKPIKLA